MNKAHRTQRARTFQAVAAVVALILVLIFAPRMEGPRILWGIPFTTKTGTPGLTNLGWGLLILAPMAAYLATGFIVRLRYRDKDH